MNFHCAILCILLLQLWNMKSIKQYLHIMSDNNLAGYKAINSVKDDYMWIVDAGLYADTS